MCLLNLACTSVQKVQIFCISLQKIAQKERKASAFIYFPSLPFKESAYCLMVAYHISQCANCLKILPTAAIFYLQVSLYKQIEAKKY